MGDYLWVCIAAFLASTLTFFSGFGLGTLLMPVFTLFFPVEVAIAATAVVHFLNNIFKFFLIGGKTDKEVLLKFGMAAIPAAFAGAYLLILLSDLNRSFDFNILNQHISFEPVKVVIGLAMLFFAFFEMKPQIKNITFEKSKLWVGGIISGFFGGLSGHQGAMRSAFLINAGLSKEGFIATGISIALIVDAIRMGIYSTVYFSSDIFRHSSLILMAIGSAISGAVIGRFLLKKITYHLIRYVVAFFLIIIGFGLFFGFI
jgi:uncharacterized membrane protein YfcA